MSLDFLILYEHPVREYESILLLQEELRRLPHRADEKQDADQVGGIPVGPEEGDIGLGQARGGGAGV